ncbi:MAG: hypothetical protein WBC37_07750 [Burkholderiaceae bacterium]
MPDHTRAVPAPAGPSGLMQLSGLAFFAVFAAVAGGIAWLVIRNRQLEKQADFDRSVRARKLGWSYDGTRDGRIEYRFAGEEGGVAWTMWYDSDRGDDTPTPKAHWSTDNLRTPRLSLVILGRRRHAMESGMVGRLLMGVVSGIAAAASGRESAPDKVEFYESAVVLEHASAAFTQQFAVAVAPDMPRGWLDEDLQRQLTRWPEGRGSKPFKPEDAVEVNLGPRGLSIIVQHMPDGMAHWQHLAELGQHLAVQLAQAHR